MFIYRNYNSKTTDNVIIILRKGINPDGIEQDRPGNRNLGEFSRRQCRDLRFSFK